MPIYFADISLHSAGHDYSQLWKAVEDAGGQRLMDTSWFVEVAQDIAEVTRAILSHLGPTDRLFLIEIRAGVPWTGTGLDQETKNWLSARMSGLRVGLPTASGKQDDIPHDIVDMTVIENKKKKRKDKSKKKSRL